MLAFRAEIAHRLEWWPMAQSGVSEVATTRSPIVFTMANLPIVCR
jgi:hypothetical protein